jgi:hypothetical protein
MSTSPIVFSPALPSELLSYIVDYQNYPSTILICSTQEEFVSSLIQDVQKQVSENETETAAHQEPNSKLSKSISLLGTPLQQIAVSRHIRTVFIPTVSHLRAYLSVFKPDESGIPKPPSLRPTSQARPPVLLAYGFLQLHRDTSEWSAQGICNTASTFVEMANRFSFQPVIVERRSDGANQRDFRLLLADPIPIPSGSARDEDGSWIGRTVTAKQVLGRWFRFQNSPWDDPGSRTTP